MNKPSVFIVLGISLAITVVSVASGGNPVKAQPLVASVANAATVTLTPASALEGVAPSNRSVSSQVALGQKQKVRGVIVQRQADRFTLRDQRGIETLVLLADSTKLIEKKSNPFRRARRYEASVLIPGLNIVVKGRGDSSGALVAETIRLTQYDLDTARAITTQVEPVEQRLGEAENRLSESEQNAKRLSGQVDELIEVSNLARGGAKAAQETADAALASINKTKERISRLDDYEVTDSLTINFKAGSAQLSPEAEAKLDDVATQTESITGYIIEVTGYASAEGSEELNRRLSQRRADAVVRYLVENHNIPIRRILMPFGYGERQPVADNSTRQGRQQNRRVEVKIFVNRGLTTPGS